MNCYLLCHGICKGFAVQVNCTLRSPQQYSHQVGSHWNNQNDFHTLMEISSADTTTLLLRPCSRGPEALCANEVVEL